MRQLRRLLPGYRWMIARSLSASGDNNHRRGNRLPLKDFACGGRLRAPHTTNRMRVSQRTPARRRRGAIPYTGCRAVGRRESSCAVPCRTTWRSARSVLSRIRRCRVRHAFGDRKEDRSIPDRFGDIAFERHCSILRFTRPHSPLMGGQWSHTRIPGMEVGPRRCDPHLRAMHHVLWLTANILRFTHYVNRLL